MVKTVSEKALLKWIQYEYELQQQLLETGKLSTGEYAGRTSVLFALEREFGLNGK